MPKYEELPGLLRLGLLHIEGTRSYLALQYWESRDAWRAASDGDFYKAWYQGYKPTLERWDEIMTFEEEWECEDILGAGNV